MAYLHNFAYNVVRKRKLEMYCCGLKFRFIYDKNIFQPNQSKPSENI